MSGESLAHVWGAKGLTPDEKLLLLWFANSDGGLGYPVCVEWVGMGEFVGRDIHDAARLTESLAEKGFIRGGSEDEETSHWAWVVYDGEYFTPPDFTQETRSRSKRVLALLDRDGPGCRYCEIQCIEYHLDHFIPKSRGGPDLLTNLILSCSTCNMAKGAKMPADWQFLQERPELLRRILISLEAHEE